MRNTLSFVCSAWSSARLTTDSLSGTGKSATPLAMTCSTRTKLISMAHTIPHRSWNVHTLAAGSWRVAGCTVHLEASGRFAVCHAGTKTRTTPIIVAHASECFLLSSSRQLLVQWVLQVQNIRFSAGPESGQLGRDGHASDLTATPNKVEPFWDRRHTSILPLCLFPRGVCITSLSQNKSGIVVD